MASFVIWVYGLVVQLGYRTVGGALLSRYLDSMDDQAVTEY
jgi:hypothetical protein